MKESLHQPKRIAAVVVTHNRLELLKDCVKGLRAQTRSLDEIIVVNNDSRDGTAEWLAAQSDLTAVTQGDVGSAGGFAGGLKTGYQNGHDWIWCMDDDSYPTPEALEFLTKCPFYAKATTGFLVSVVLWKDGAMHSMCVPATVSGEEWLNRVLEEKCVPVKSTSYIGLMVSRTALGKVGYPLKDFYLWCDDCDFTLRISEHFSCFVVLESKVVHQTKDNVGSGDQISLDDNHSIKFQCYHRNSVALTLLAKISLARRIKRIMTGVAAQIGCAKSFGRKLAILRYSLSGIFLYLKLRKADTHQ